MDISHGFVDNIKSEKAKALARYQMFTNITKLFHLMEVFAAVALVSWSSTRLPLVIKFSSEYVSAFSSYFTNQHVVFLVGNAIVIICYMLSRNPDSSNVLESGFQYNDVLSFDKTDKTSLSQVTETQIPSIINEEKEVKKFQRTKSDKMKRRVPVKQLRRSVTGTRRSEDSTVAVENLSNEEFRIAVETFIKKQQRLLKQQNMDEEDI